MKMASFEMRSWGPGWLVIHDGEIFESDEKQELVDLLFELLKAKIS
jgi:hypothetical protein